MLWMLLYSSPIAIYTQITPLYLSSITVAERWQSDDIIFKPVCIVPCFVYSFYTDISLHFEYFLEYKD